MKYKTRSWLVVAAGVALSCGGNGDDGADAASTGGVGAAGRGTGGGAGRTGTGGGPAHGGTGQGADAGAAGESTSAGGGAAEAGAAGEWGATSAGAGGESGGAGSGDMPGPVVDLPTGSRERNGVVNLVDADAAAELDAFILGMKPSLSTPVNLFLKYYVEQYDFVYFFTDHTLPSAEAYGKSTIVTAHGLPGRGIDYDLEMAGYTTNGRLKSAIAIQYEPGAYGPFVHELMHHWGIYLSTEFGFGVGLNPLAGGHWGFAGVQGVLGGFDATTLRCQTPAAASPPNCTPETNGRYRYRVGNFTPTDNAGKVLAPFELYLIGLLPASELPTSVPVLTSADLVNDSYDGATDTLEVEASGVSTVETSAIITREGSVPLLAANERAFTAAFVVISATPVADAILDDVGERAKNHGGRSSTANRYPSFAASTGGRATLDTRLGPRRAAGEAPPAVRVPHTCNVAVQDCDAGQACYFWWGAGRCGTPHGAGKSDEPCTAPSDCAAGFGCAQNRTSGRQACEAYCSPNGADPNSCFTACSSHYFLPDDNNLIVGGTCEPPP